MSLHISSQWGSSGHVMGLGISAGAKQKQKDQEYTKQCVARGVVEKIRTQMCDDKQEPLESH